MPLLPRSTGYLFLALYTLSVTTGTASVPYVLVCAAQAGLLARVAWRPPLHRPLLSAALPAAVLAYAPVALAYAPGALAYAPKALAYPLAAATAGLGVPNLDCLLAATLLRCVRGRARWVAFALASVASGVLRPGGPYAVLTTAAIGAVMHSLLRLPELVTRLDATRDDLARAVVAAERLRVADRLRAALGDRLGAVTGCLRRARVRLDERPEAAREAAADAGRTVRAMIEEVRSTAAALREDDLPSPDPAPADRLAPRLAMTALVVSLFTWTARQAMESERYEVAVAVAAGGAVMSGLLLAQLLRPRVALPLLAAQAALALVPLPWLGADWCVWLILLAAAVLLQQRPWWPVPAALALVALRAGYTERPDRLVGGVGWAVFAMEAVLVLFGLARFWQLSSELSRSRAELAAVSLEIERWRLSRDIHDLLGLGLSVLALKSDLIAELTTRRPDRARAEIDEALRIAARARVEARAALEDHTPTSLRHELAVARETLAAEGIAVRVTGDEGLVEAAALVPVLREAVTNVLRHSAATRVDIGFRREGETLRMDVRNDGVRDVPPPSAATGGRGLRNMRARVTDAGGGLTVSAAHGTFLVSVALPLAAADTGAGAAPASDPAAGHAKCTPPTTG
ncbi:histidine kinase [Streptomyces sp. NPDC004787]|uniref:sensor histidine kinase n=1 Tax=Streptomyces sp. NPDC004787 TaxID=3154291 RepID=UPI0033B8DB56